MPEYISQLRVSNNDYLIKAKQLADDVNLKTINLSSVVGSGDISTMQAHCDDASETLFLTNSLANAANLEA